MNKIIGKIIIDYDLKKEELIKQLINNGDLILGELHEQKKQKIK